MDPVLPDDVRCPASGTHRAPQRRLVEWFDLAFGGGVIPTWTTRLHSHSDRLWLAAPITVEVQAHRRVWSIVAEVQLLARLHPACSHLAVAATSSRSIYGGVATRVQSSRNTSRRTKQVWRAELLVDLPGNYTLFVDVDTRGDAPSRCGKKAAASVPLLSGNESRLTLWPKDNTAGGASLPRARVVPSARCSSASAMAGRWLRCDALPIASHTPSCVAALPRHWAWAPWRCWWELVPIADRAANTASPIWLVVAGNSAVRGRWNAALMDLMAMDGDDKLAVDELNKLHVRSNRTTSRVPASAANYLLRKHWKCWGALDVVKGALRVTYRDYREYWNARNKARLSGIAPNVTLLAYKQECETWWATLRTNAAKRTGPRLVYGSFWDVRTADLTEHADALAYHAAMAKGVPFCFGSTNAIQADVQMARCQDMRWRAARLAQLYDQPCFLDEWTLDHPVVHAHESYNFGGGSGFSVHSYFQRAPRTVVQEGEASGSAPSPPDTAAAQPQHDVVGTSIEARDNSSWFRGNSEAMMLQVLLQLASERPAVDASAWVQPLAAKARVRQHCPKMYGGQYALNYFFRPRDISGVGD